MADFKPTSHGLAAMPGQSEEKAPETALPAVGDTMKIAVNPWGFFQVVDNETRVGEGSKVIEVTVNSVKTAVVTFE